MRTKTKIVETEMKVADTKHPLNNNRMVGNEGARGERKNVSLDSKGK